MTRFRIIMDGDGFSVQAKGLLFWGRAFAFRNWFETAELAEKAVDTVIRHSKTDGTVVKEISG